MLQLPQRNGATNALGDCLRLGWCLWQVRTRGPACSLVWAKVIDRVRLLTRAYRPASIGMQRPEKIRLQPAQDWPWWPAPNRGRCQRRPAHSVNGGLARKGIVGRVLRCDHSLRRKPARICRHGSKRARQPVSPCKIASDAHAKSIRGELPRNPRQLDWELVAQNARRWAIDKASAWWLFRDAKVFRPRHAPGLVIRKPLRHLFWLISRHALIVS